MKKMIHISSPIFHALMSKGVNTFQSDDVITAFKKQYPEGQALNEKIEWIKVNSHDGFITLQGTEFYEDFQVASLENSPYIIMLKEKCEEKDQQIKVLLEQQNIQG